MNIVFGVAHPRFHAQRETAEISLRAHQQPKPQSPLSNKQKNQDNNEN